MFFLTEQTIWEIKKIHHKFCQQFAESQVIAANFNWNLLALKSTLRMELLEEMQKAFPYTDMPEELPVFVAMCQKRDK